MRLPATVSVGVIHCGINDINGALSHTYGPREIAENVISCGSKLRERHPLMSIIIMGVLPTVEAFWGSQESIIEVNRYLQILCNEKKFRFVETCDFLEEFYYKDGLHLNKKGCKKLGDINSCWIDKKFSSTSIS